MCTNVISCKALLIFLLSQCALKLPLLISIAMQTAEFARTIIGQTTDFVSYMCIYATCRSL